MKPVDSSTPVHAGRVVFVGAGPGAADLLTLRAREMLEAADAVVHDTLVPVEILAMANPTAERLSVAHTVRDGVDHGTQTGERLVELARRHRLVVRLKGGDPTVFARLAEELDVVRRAGLSVEVVPGVTAALAAAAAAAVPLTSRTMASCLTILTGHEADAKESSCDFRALAVLPGTLAVYMGVEQAAQWSRRLLEAGVAGDTPVTIVSRASRADERIGSTTLARAAADVLDQGWRPPAVLLVGKAVAGGGTGPLAGQRVLVTRPAGQGGELAGLVRAAGGSTVAAPLVTIEPPESWEPLDRALARADTYDWIVLASVNGVRSLLARLRATRRDARSLGSARLAAIGPATARALDDAGLVADLEPTTFSSEGLVAALAAAPPRSRFLVVRADRSRDVLGPALREQGHVVDEVVAYRSVPVTAIDEAALEPGGIDWITLTSPTIARTATRLFGARMRSWKIASLSPVTSAAIREAGFTPTVEPPEATAAGLVAAMIAHGPPAAPPSDRRAVQPG